MLTDTTRQEWMRGWCDGAFDIAVGLLSHREALAYMRSSAFDDRRRLGAREYGYVAALSAALGVI